jgi:3-deoxy-D-manno-octulosonate 8-phosphate phosphatase (KDO 8-P phosphatase)
MDARERALGIKMILMDVDGTLTDGSLLLLPDGEELKSYNVRDGLGIILARLAGIKTGIITGKTSRPLEKRSERLRIDELYQGILDKKEVLLEILDKHGLGPEQAAYIGDDLGDLEVMQTVGLAGAVADAHPKIKENCHFISPSSGGKGAVREFIEFILESQNLWDEISRKVKDLDKIRVLTEKERRPEKEG